MPRTVSPYDHLDHRVFLAAWFASKKESNPRFSHRMFARMAGQKSPSLLLHVIEGRRNLTAATTEAFIEAMKLRAGEADFFRLLVELDQARTEEERNRVWERISATRRFRSARNLDRRAFAYLSTWYLPALRELATRSDFRADPAWIAGQMVPSITVNEATEGLETLVDLGLLVERDGTLVPAEASVATPPEVTGLAVRNYHRGMIDQARASIERFPPEERHLLAVTVGVPPSLMPVLKAESNAFFERMMDLCDSSEEEVDQVLQLNLQIFPLTHPREPS